MSELVRAAEVHQKLCVHLSGPGGWCRLKLEAGSHCYIAKPSTCERKAQPTAEQSRAWEKRWASQRS